MISVLIMKFCDYVLRIKNVVVVGLDCLVIVLVIVMIIFLKFEDDEYKICWGRVNRIVVFLLLVWGEVEVLVFICDMDQIFFVN